MIEHNTDVLKTADHIVDLGPDGGIGGGRILFAGTPEELAKSDTYTAHYMAEELVRSSAGRGKDISVDLDDLTAIDDFEPEEEDLDNGEAVEEEVE